MGKLIDNIKRYRKELLFGIVIDVVLIITLTVLCIAIIACRADSAVEGCPGYKSCYDAQIATMRTYSNLTPRELVAIADYDSAKALNRLAEAFEDEVREIKTLLIDYNENYKE